VPASLVRSRPDQWWRETSKAGRQRRGHDRRGPSASVCGSIRFVLRGAASGAVGVAAHCVVDGVNLLARVPQFPVEGRAVTFAIFRWLVQWWGRVLAAAGCGLWLCRVGVSLGTCVSPRARLPAAARLGRSLSRQRDETPDAPARGAATSVRPRKRGASVLSLDPSYKKAAARAHSAKFRARASPYTAVQHGSTHQRRTR
jgi:hypothetical protein